MITLQIIEIISITFHIVHIATNGNYVKETSSHRSFNSVLLFIDHSQNDVQYAAVNFCTTGSVGGFVCILCA
jgi:hypothetical protein